MLRFIPRIREEAPAALLRAGIPPHVARVLHARGIETVDEANAFLSPSADGLHDPSLLFGMEAAVSHIREALSKGRRICIYGDYDVDGVCAVAILQTALLDHGANVFSYIPSRHREGYGLNMDAVRRIAEEATLLITVDCGITSIDEARLAKELGLSLVITDHHEPPERLPEAVALVNPLLGAYPFRRLCGAGVALKLAQALFGFDAVAKLIDLAALATVADLVPLLCENRILVSLGLSMMQDTKRAGLRALFDAAGILGREITAGHLGFQIAPRINAGGRLADASQGVTLLTTEDARVAAEIAGMLSEANQQRQRMELSLLGEAEKWVAEHVDFLREKAIVVVGEGWNTGVLGLVASRLTERFAWPAIVFSEADGVLTGSARSIPGVNIHAALTRCADLFIRFGGHAQAAGVTLAPENIDAFRVRLNEAIAELAEPDAFLPSAAYDFALPLADVTIPLIEQFRRLAPFGFGNPSPVFRATGAKVMEARGVGAEGKHLKLKLSQDGAAVSGIAFSQGALLTNLPESIDVLFSPSINEYMGRRSAQCEVSRIIPHAPLENFRARCEAGTDDFDIALLEEETDVTSFPPSPAVERALIREALLSGCQGTLLTVRTRSGALDWLDWLKSEGLSDRLVYCFGAPQDKRRFNALCAIPEKGADAGYARVFALDDAFVPKALQEFMPSDDALRNLYRVLRAGNGRFASESALALAAGMRVAAVRLGLRAFDELGLLRYRPAPFRAALLPAGKCSLDESPALQRARRMLAWEADA